MIEEAIDWFEGLGWVANAITIGSLAFAALVVFRNRVRDLLRDSSFVKLAERRFGHRWTDSASKTIAEIAIVDDDPSDFPISELRDNGLKVKSYKQVRLNDLGTLAQYDVVFLDMHGVVRDDVSEGGLRLIGRLREANPRQRICAVSSKTFDPTAMSFFQQAHDVKKKPMTAQACSAVIDDFLREKLDPIQLSEELEAKTSTLSGSERRQLLTDIKKFAESSADVREFRLAHFEDDRRFVVGVRDFVRMLRAIR